MLLITRLIFLCLALLFNKSSFADNNQPQLLNTLLTAEFAIQRGHYVEAADLYISAAKQHATHYQLNERAAKLALHTGNFPAFLESALLWHNDKPDHHSQLHLALAYGFNAQHQLALDTMFPLLQHNTSSNFTQLAKLVSEETAKDKNYLEQLERAALQHPDHLDLILSNALTFSFSDEKKALNYLAKALSLKPQQDISEHAILVYQRLNRLDLAINFLQEQILVNPSDSYLHHQLLHIAELLGPISFQEQLHFLTTADPTNNRYLISLASIYLQQDNKQDAQQLLEQALLNDAAYDPAHLYLGSMYTQTMQYEQAIKHLLQVSSNSNDYWLAQEHLTYAYLEQEDFQLAEHSIEQYFLKHELKDSLANWINLKASLLEKEGNKKQALRLFNKAVKAQPDSINIRYARAMLAERTNRLKLCEADLRHILSLHPEHAITLNALGYILTDRTNRHAEAFELIKKSLKLQPNDAATIDSMGWVLYHLGRIDEALGHLEKAYNMLPDAEIAAHLITVLWSSGKEQRAQDIAQQALQAWPSNPILLKTVNDLEI